MENHEWIGVRSGNVLHTFLNMATEIISEFSQLSDRDFPVRYVKVYQRVYMLLDHHFQWEIPLCLWPFSIANC